MRGIRVQETGRGNGTEMENLRLPRRIVKQAKEEKGGEKGGGGKEERRKDKTITVMIPAAK